MAQRRSRLRFLLWVLLIGFLAGGVCLYVVTTPAGLKTVLGLVWGRSVDLKSVDGGLQGPVEMTGLSVADRPGFGEAPFFEAERVKLSFRPWVLIYRGFDELELEKPRLSLVVNEAGKANYDDLLTSGGRSLMLPVRKIELLDGQIRFEDREKDTVRIVEGVNWKTVLLPEARGIGATGWLKVEGADWILEQAHRVVSLEVQHQVKVLRVQASEFSGWLPRLRGSVRVDAILMGLYQNVRGTARFEETGFVVATECVLYGGELDLKGKVDYQKERLSVGVTAEVDNMPSERLLKEGLKLNLPLSGRVTMVAAVTGQIDAAWKPVDKTWKAHGRARIKQGKLVNWSWLKRAAGGVKELGALDLEDVDIEDLEVPFEVTHETITFHNLTATAEGIPCTLDGSLGRQPDGRLDLVLDLDMPVAQLNLGGFGQILSAFLRDDSGRIPVRLEIRGTKKQPLVEVSMLPGLSR